MLNVICAHSDVHSQRLKFTHMDENALQDFEMFGPLECPKSR